MRLFSRLTSAIVLACCLCCASCSSDDQAVTETPSSTTPDAPDHVADIERFCGHCHAFPDPAAFPREEWRTEVAQGFRFFYASPVEGLIIPPEEAVVAWFEDRAPEQHELTVDEIDDSESPRFERVDVPELDVAATAVATVRFLPQAGQLWACDMRTGHLLAADIGEPLRQAARPLVISNPCLVEMADLNGDQRNEVLVADLGSFLPEDHDRGGVWSFSPDADWEAQPILFPAARVSDVQTGDLDGDGDLDLAVAEFGWRRTGRLLVLWNQRGGVEWETQELDDRHGAIHAPIVDLNNDGRLDVVALFAQEHEVVCAYLQQADGRFERVDLYDAGEPSFGSSGIEVMDFDVDGDLDVLHTNGDSFDSGHPKPYHGIRWLENRGAYPFTIHELAVMPGVHRALAADLDLDGDTDVAAVSLLPPSADRTHGFASVLWLEHHDDGEFTRHILEVDQCRHSCCELVDWDGDRDLDLFVSNFSWNEETGTAVTVFLNKSR